MTAALLFVCYPQMTEIRVRRGSYLTIDLHIYNTAEKSSLPFSELVCQTKPLSAPNLSIPRFPDPFE